VADRGWKRRFDEPIPLPRGRQFVTLEDAGTYITKLAKAEHKAAEWQAATEALILVAASGGPMHQGSTTILLSQCLVALARLGFERLKVKDLDHAAGVADGPIGLYFARHLGDRSATDAEHLREKFLREGDEVALCAIACLK
jgi:hypothetical protein